MIYHIASSNPNECVVCIEAKKISDSNNINIYVSNKETQTQELTNYIYRQRTLQHLYIVSDFLKRKNEKINNNNSDSIFKMRMLNYSTSDQLIYEEEKTIRDNLRKFIEEMKIYMEENNLNDDKFMKNLCDDIYISYRTFGTKFATMYNNARQTSQGTQRCYNVSHTPDEDETQQLHSSSKTLTKPKLQRQQAVYDDITLDNFINHTVSGFADAPYLTPTSTRLMRDISSSCEINTDGTELSHKI